MNRIQDALSETIRLIQDILHYILSFKDPIDDVLVMVSVFYTILYNFK